MSNPDNITTRKHQSTSSVGPQRGLTCDEISDIVSKAMETVRKDIAGLPTKEFLEEAISKVAEKFNEKFEEKNREIESLKERLDIVEARLAILETLDKRVEEQEQYSRRVSLRIQGIPLPSTGSKEDCVKKVNDVFQKLDCGVTIDSIDRAHRIGPKIKSDDGSPPKQQMIVKFTSFRDRTKVYRARKKSDDVKIRLDLTKKRIALLNKASEIAKQYPCVQFVFTDVNCNLAAKMKNGGFIFFNSVEEFMDKILPPETEEMVSEEV